MFKAQQVLRTSSDQTSVDGTFVPSGTRVIVLKDIGGDRYRVKVAQSGFAEAHRLELSADALSATSRGRPRKEAVTA